jgi:hypothetical protein
MVGPVVVASCPERKDTKRLLIRMASIISRQRDGVMFFGAIGVATVYNAAEEAFLGGSCARKYFPKCWWNIMAIYRRKFIGVAAAIVSLASGLDEISAQDSALSNPPLPNPALFESGDLLWPKKPGQFVPYRSVVAADSVEDEEERWLREKQEFIKRARASTTYFNAEELGTLEKLSFREFYARYAGDQKPGIPGAYSSGNGIYVGHVAILYIDDEKVTWVIEALWGKGVVRSSYAGPWP